MYKVLIIDDEKPTKIAITALLERKNYPSIKSIATASNGKEGLFAMRELQPDIVFVDMNMPIMNGIEFLETVHIEFSNVVYVVISGYDEFEYAKAALKNGASDYILKPIREEELYSSLEKIISQLNLKRNINDVREKDQAYSPSMVIDIVREYIDQNYCREIRIDMFTKKYHISKEYLLKLFKKKYGCGIYEYSLNLRMKRAKELLQDYSLQIQEISDRLGYSNNNYFSKAFKNHYNMSPSEFRDITTKNDA